MGGAEIREGSDSRWDVLTFAKSSVHSTKYFRQGRRIMLLVRSVFEGGVQHCCFYDELISFCNLRPIERKKELRCSTCAKYCAGVVWAIRISAN